MGTINRKTEERIRKMGDIPDKQKAASNALDETVKYIKADGNAAQRRIWEEMENFIDNVSLMCLKKNGTSMVVTQLKIYIKQGHEKYEISRI